MRLKIRQQQYLSTISLIDSFSVIRRLRIVLIFYSMSFLEMRKGKCEYIME